MRALSTGLILLVALVNLVPVVGVVSADRVEALYGVELGGPDLVILMRHRAVLFGVVGALLVGAAWRPALRGAGIAAGLVSMGSFVVVAWLVGGYGAAIERVVVVDVVASIVLVVAALLARLEPRVRGAG